MTTVAARVLAVTLLAGVLVGCSGSGQDRSESAGTADPTAAGHTTENAGDTSGTASATSETPVTTPDPGSTSVPTGAAPPGDGSGEWPPGLPQPAGCENVTAHESEELTLVSCTIAGDADAALAAVVTALTDSGATIIASGVANGLGSATATTADGRAIEVGLIADPDQAGRCIVMFSTYR